MTFVVKATVPLQFDDVTLSGENYLEEDTAHSHTLVISTQKKVTFLKKGHRVLDYQQTTVATYRTRYCRTIQNPSDLWANRT